MDQDAVQPNTQLAPRDDPDGTLAASVTIAEPETMNLLGLMLASVLRRRLEEPSGVRHACALRGEVTIEASGMQITLAFDSGRIRVSRGRAGRARARLSGTLEALLAAALGQGRVRSVLTGRLRVRGGPLTLWHLLHLVRSPI